MFGLSTLATQAIMAAVIFAAGAAGGATATYKLEEGKVARIELGHVTALAKAEAEAAAHQRTFDNIALDTALRERNEQAQRAAVAEASIRDVGAHVSISVIGPACVPLGFIRLLDAAASGRSTGTLLLPAGKSDGSCAPVAWDAVARSVVSNYDRARANAIQLNALIGAYRQAQASR